MTPRVALYGRQSKGDTQSIADQLELQQKEAVDNGWRIVSILRDDVSASRYTNKKRDDWPKLLELIVDGAVDLVSMWKPNRGDRKAADWLAFLGLCEEHKVKLRITSNRRTYDMVDPNDFKAMAYEGVDADAFSRNLSSDIQRGIDSNAAKGKPHGRLLYGYLREYDKGRVAAQVPHPHQADVVRSIFKQFSEGVSLRRIVGGLNNSGVASPREEQWGIPTVRRILLNRGYLGERWHKGQYAGEGIWPALVDARTFATVGEILSDPSRLTRKDGSFKHWLSGVAICDVCEKPLRVYRHRGVEQYRCIGRKCVMIRKDELEDYVGEEVRDRMLKIDETPSDPVKAAKRERALAEIARLTTLIDTIDEQILDDVISSADGNRQIAKARERIAAHQKVAEANVADKVVRVLRNAGVDWFGMEPEQKRKVAQNLVTVRVKRVGKFGPRKDRDLRERVLVDDAELQEVEV